MLSTVSTNVGTIARELIELDIKLKPLLERYEALKDQMREAGPDNYLTDLGVVKVSAASEPRFKGIGYDVNEDAVKAMPATQRSALIQKGIITPVDRYTRASKSKVEVVR